MKIRIFGFAPKATDLPAPMSPVDGFESISKIGSVNFGEKYTYAVTKMDSWYAGVALKYRDSKAFTAVTKEADGKITLKAELIGEGKQLAEPNFFLVHASTGRGIYAHHQSSASLLGDFAWLSKKTFETERKKILGKLLEDESSDGGKSKLRRDYRGTYTLELLVRAKSFASYVKALKKVSSLEATVMELKVTEPQFQRLFANSRKHSFRIIFDPSAAMDEIKETIVDIAKTGSFDQATVEGKDMADRNQAYKLIKDAQVFEEIDYDEAVADLTLDFADWTKSIQTSLMMKRLVGLATQPEILRRLEMKIK